MTNTTTTADEIAKTLRHIVENEPASIRAYVAREALGYDDPTLMFANLQQGGCVCGTINSLIYYRDTHAFFDTYYEEIEELREQYEDEMGEPLRVNGDLKNWLAWFAFEETAFPLAGELGLEL